jgi:cytochrome c peroxidase
MPSELRGWNGFSCRLAVSILALACVDCSIAIAQPPFEFGALPPVVHPPDNLPSQSKIALGKQLFFDPRLSRTNRISCATCHDPARGWSDGRSFSTGVDDQLGSRSAPSLINVAYNRSQFWDGRAGSLEEQALEPIQDSKEMDMSLETLAEKVNGIAGYRRQFRDVFGSDASSRSIAQSIAAYERTILVVETALDQFLQGDQNALTPSAQRGMQLFFGHAHCHLCHAGPNLSDNKFHNIGIGLKAKVFDTGRQKISRRGADRGAFKTPSLREIARTAPYMHDGSFKTLQDVVWHYNFGGVTNEANDDRDDALEVLYMSDQQVDDLVEFLKEGLSSQNYPLHEPPRLPNQ